MLTFAYNLAFLFRSEPEMADVQIGFVVRLAIILGAVAVGLGVWALVSVGFQMLDKWKEKFLAETEMEMEEMLMQIPAAKILNYSLIIAAILAVLIFGITAPSPRGFNWKFGTVASIVIFASTMAGSRYFLKFLRTRRLNKFNDQLEEALMSMGNALKAGFSINQAVEMVIKQKRNPISLEFKLMMQQTQLGVSFDDALRNMARRVGSEDFHLVATSIITARQTGGDLTGVFARLANVIRERLRIQRRIRTLTAQGRLQGTVLGSLPIVLLGILYFFVDPTIVRNFFSHPVGIVGLILFVILEVCGFLTIRKIVNIDI